MQGLNQGKNEVQYNPVSASTFEELRMLEIEQSRAAMAAKQARLMRRRQINWMARLWPIGLGLFLSFITPELLAVAERIGPSGMMLVYPYVELTKRPELYINNIIAYWLPLGMTYAQFPIMGALTRLFLRDRVGVIRTVRMFLLLQVLGILQVWLVSGGFGDLFRM